MISSMTGTTNNTASAKTIAPIALGLQNNYAVIIDDPKECVLNSLATPQDQEEKISYKFQPQDSISATVEVQNPSRVKKGVQYVVKIENVLKTTDSVDATYRVDEPLVAYLVIRHCKSANVTPDTISNLVLRLLGACRDDSGNWIFGNLMRSAINPKR